MSDTMITIHVTDRDGVEHEKRIPTGDPLMFALRDDAGLPVEGACGGSATCGTCHIVLADSWATSMDQPTDFEAAMLDMLEHYQGPTSRLACQLTVTEAMDGMVLRLAPEE